MSSIVSGTEIVFEFPAEFFRDGRVFEEDRVLSVAV